MNWEGLNQFNTIIGIINGVWGIGNMVWTSFNFFSKKKKESFKNQLIEERKAAQKENARVCRTCKHTFNERIKDLKFVNAHFMEQDKQKEA